MPPIVYILTVRENSETNRLLANLGVFSSLSSALGFVITQRKTQNNKYISGGILKYQTVDALDAYVLQDFGSFVFLYSNDFYKVIAEKAVLY